MENTFDELNELNAPYTLVDGKIQVLNFQPFLDKLFKLKPGPIKTGALLNFMASLKGSNKSSGNNGISRLQTFLNAYVQEIALISENSDILKFSKEDHLGLVRDGHGEKEPDFNFYSQNGNIYTIEAKMYWDQQSFETAKQDTNFHNADYVCLFFIKDTKFRWAFAKKADNYETIYKLFDLKDSDPQLLELSLPTSLQTISFDIDNKLTDADVPAEITYKFFNN